MYPQKLTVHEAAQLGVNSTHVNPEITLSIGEIEKHLKNLPVEFHLQYLLLLKTNIDLYIHNRYGKHHYG